MAKFLLGIDNGGTVSKAAVFTETGRECAVAGRPVHVLSPNPGWSERDMSAVWADTAAAIREAIETSGVNPEDIACVSCTGHGNGLYLIDAAGEPVRNGIYSSDSRAASIIADWKARGIDAQALPKTAQCVWPAQPNALLAWLREHEPRSLQRAEALLMAKDYTRFRLTGHVAMELTDMSGTSLMNVITKTYDDQILELFGIPEFKRLLPPLVQSDHVCGTVTEQAAAETGLKAGTPVAGGMFDIDACGLASGCRDERQFVIVTGTWGNNQYIAREPLVDKGLFMTSCYSIPGWYLMLEGSPTGAGNLEWFIKTLLPEKKASLESDALLSWANAEVASVTPTEDAPFFLPFLYGENVGYPAKATFLGLSSQHTRAEVMRAVYEGCAFSHNMHLQRLYGFRSRPEVVRLTGGAARSNVWMQMFADIFQLPVEIPDGAELGALGAAIAGAVACGIHDSYDTAIPAMTRVARRYEPDSTRALLYAKRYARYCDAIRALNSFYQ